MTLESIDITSSIRYPQFLTTRVQNWTQGKSFERSKQLIGLLPFHTCYCAQTFCPFPSKLPLLYGIVLLVEKSFIQSTSSSVV